MNETLIFGEYNRDVRMLWIQMISFLWYLFINKIEEYVAIDTVTFHENPLCHPIKFIQSKETQFPFAEWLGIFIPPPEDFFLLSD